jgi:hypothetical protein
MELSKIQDKSKYYVRDIDGSIKLAVLIYKIDNKYHRVISVVNENTNPYTEVILKEFNEYDNNGNVIGKKMGEVTIKKSLKESISDYINKIGDRWVENDFIIDPEIGCEFTDNIKSKIISNWCLAYGFNKRNLNWIPVRFENDVKLFNHEYRMMVKPV